MSLYSNSSSRIVKSGLPCCSVETYCFVICGLMRDATNDYCPLVCCTDGKFWYRNLDSCCEQFTVDVRPIFESQYW